MKLELKSVELIKRIETAKPDMIIIGTYDCSTNTVDLNWVTYNRARTLEGAYEHWQMEGTRNNRYYRNKKRILPREMAKELGEIHRATRYGQEDYISEKDRQELYRQEL